MQIEYQGVILDTDKPVYVYGYTITDTWFPWTPKDCACHVSDEYKKSARGFYIKTIEFEDDFEVEKRGIKKIHLVGKNYRNAFGRVIDLGCYGFGATPQAAKKMFLAKNAGTRV